MPTGLEKIRALREADRKALHKKIGIMVIAAVVLWLVMSCMRSTEIGFVAPLQAFKNIITAIRLGIADLFHWDLVNQKQELIAAHPYYFETLGNCRATLVALVMGAALSISGAVYQNVFRNPIATPSMLGISSGVNISNLILVTVFGTMATTMMRWRYLLGFLVGCVCLLLLYLLSRLMSGKKSSVTDMLLLGTVFMRVIQNLINVYEFYLMDDEQYLLLEEMNLYGTNLYEGGVILFVFGVLAVSVVIILLLRFSLNAVSFSDEEAKTMGVNAGRLRLLVLFCGTLLVIAAQVTLGDIGMLALLIPHVCRGKFGCDFRVVLLGSAGLGALAMMICRLIRYLLKFDPFLELISMGSIINVVTIPLLLFILWTQQRAWRQN